MAWHGDTDRFVPVGRRSWGEYRGFAEVVVTEGTAAEQVVTKHQFFRGMHGDKLCHTACTTTKTVLMSTGLPVSTGYGQPTDLDELSGLPLLRHVPDPSGTQDHSRVVNRYVTTGTLGVDPNVTWVEPFRDYVYANGQYSRTDYAYDAYSRPSTTIEWGQVNSSYDEIAGHFGENDARCTKTQYTAPSTWWPLGRTQRGQHPFESGLFDWRDVRRDLQLQRIRDPTHIDRHPNRWRCRR